MQDERTEYREFSVRVPLRLVDKLDDCATQDHRSRNGEVVFILERYLREREQSKQDKQQQGVTR